MSTVAGAAVFNIGYALVLSSNTSPVFMIVLWLVMPSVVSENGEADSLVSENIANAGGCVGTAAGGDVAAPLETWLVAGKYPKKFTVEMFALLSNFKSS